MAIWLDAPNVLNFIKNNVAGRLIKQIRVKWENLWLQYQSSNKGDCKSSLVPRRSLGWRPTGVAWNNLRGPPSTIFRHNNIRKWTFGFYFECLRMSSNLHFWVVWVNLSGPQNFTLQTLIKIDFNLRIRNELETLNSTIILHLAVTLCRRWLLHVYW